MLPLRTLRLYEAGVGYFERSGTLDKSAELTLPVPAAHMDDALKSLVVLGDPGGAAVSSVEFDSVVSNGMALALAGLPSDAQDSLDYRELLVSMKGARVEVLTAHDRFAAQLIDVFEAPAEEGKLEVRVTETNDEGEAVDHYRQREVLWLLWLTEDQGIRRIAAKDILHLKPLDPAYASRLKSAVDTLSSRAAQHRRYLRVIAQSSKPITLGYVAETPIWRTSYRLVLGESAPSKSTSRNDEPGAMLQGWALIHNDTDEHWRDVSIELVSGMPDSYLFPLAAPRYTRRELARPAESLSTVPQLVSQTPDQIWGDNASGTGQGFGSGYGRLGGSHRTRAPSMRMGATSVSLPSGARTDVSSKLAIGNLAEIAPATGVESGALFNYHLARPIELRAHGSALVPFVQRPIRIRRLTRFDAPDATGRSALWVTNTTRQTLPAGSLSIFEDARFAGESALARMKPGERTVLEFGGDLDVELARKSATSTNEPRSLRWDDDGPALVVDFVRHHEQSFVIANRATTSRTVALRLDVVKNSRVTGADETDYDPGASAAYAVFEVPPRRISKRQIEIEEGLQESVYLGSITTELLQDKLSTPVVTAAQREILARASRATSTLESLSAELSDAQQGIETIDSDLERLRQHLTALGDKSGSPAGANPLVTRILETEDALAELREKVRTLEEQRDAARDQLQGILAELNADADESDR